MLHHYCRCSTVYILTVKGKHSIEIWTHSHLCFPFVCDSCMWPCSGKSYNGREDCSAPSQLTCYEQFFTNIHWPCVSSGSVGYPCITGITVMKPDLRGICERLFFIIVFNQLDAQNLFHIWYHHTYRCDDTRCCVMQFWPPHDEHMCSKHVEAWNKTYCETNFVHQFG